MTWFGYAAGLFLAGAPVKVVEHRAARLSRHRPKFWLAWRMTTASVITFALATALSLPQGYWAVLTAVIVTQGSVGSSLKAAIERLGGSVCGAGVGASIALAIPHQTPVLLGIALALATAPLAGLAAFVPSFRIAPVTAIIVLLSTTSATLGPIGYAADRIFEIALGSLVGLIVSTLVSPELLELGTSEVYAFQTCVTLYRIHDPAISMNDARSTVAEWIFAYSNDERSFVDRVIAFYGGTGRLRPMG